MQEIFGFIPLKTIYIMIHLLGVAIGAGGAFMSDVMYMNAVKDKRLDKTENRFLKLGSTMVWVGLGLLLISGALLFSTNPSEYMQSTKFISKMIVVLILTINGFVFHFVHTPVFEKVVSKNMSRSKIFRSKSLGIYISGAISITSWSYALILGSLKTIPYSVADILLIYAGLLGVAITFALIARIIFLRR